MAFPAYRIPKIKYINERKTNSKKFNMKSRHRQAIENTNYCLGITYYNKWNSINIKTLPKNILTERIIPL